MVFRKPTKKQLRLAIDERGVAKDLYLSAALKCDSNLGANEGHFDEIVVPGDEDWLACFPESVYSFKKYKKSTPLPRKHRNTLYIQPFGSFEPENSPDIEDIRRYAEIYFQMPTKLLTPMGLFETKKRTQMIMGDTTVGCRKDHTGDVQLLVSDLLHILVDNRPSDAHCVMGLTMCDLYPGKEWNFVFGAASAAKRVGVFSFARYSPLFYEDSASLDNQDRQLMLRRSISVMVHETGHMMGLPHCVYFQCMMNGANSLEESDRQPAYACPACLRKLQYHLSFDARKRYSELLDFYEEKQLQDEFNWLQQRIAYIESLIN